VDFWATIASVPRRDAATSGPRGPLPVARPEADRHFCDDRAGGGRLEFLRKHNVPCRLHQTAARRRQVHQRHRPEMERPIARPVPVRPPGAKAARSSVRPTWRRWKPRCGNCCDASREHSPVEGRSAWITAASGSAIRWPWRSPNRVSAWFSATAVRRTRPRRPRPPRGFGRRGARGPGRRLRSRERPSGGRARATGVPRIDILVNLASVYQPSGSTRSASGSGGTNRVAHPGHVLAVAVDCP